LQLSSQIICVYVCAVLEITNALGFVTI